VFDLRDLAAAEVPHFELDEDPAFWKYRNVQVCLLIAGSCAPCEVHQSE
jgi:kinesin family member 15